MTGARKQQILGLFVLGLILLVVFFLRSLWIS